MITKGKAVALAAGRHVRKHVGLYAWLGFIALMSLAALVIDDANTIYAIEFAVLVAVYAGCGMVWLFSYRPTIKYLRTRNDELAEQHTLDREKLSRTRDIIHTAHLAAIRSGNAELRDALSDLSDRSFEISFPDYLSPKAEKLADIPAEAPVAEPAPVS